VCLTPLVLQQTPLDSDKNGIKRVWFDPIVVFLIPLVMKYWSLYFCE